MAFESPCFARAITRDSSLFDGPSLETRTWGSMLITGVTAYLRCLRHLRFRRPCRRLDRCRLPYLDCRMPRADLTAVSLCVSRRFVASLCVEPEKGTLSAEAGEAEVVPGAAGAPRRDRRRLSPLWLGRGPGRPHHHFFQRDGSPLSSTARSGAALPRSALLSRPRRPL